MRRRKVEKDVEEKEAIWESKPPVDYPMHLLASREEWVGLRIFLWLGPLNKKMAND